MKTSMFIIFCVLSCCCSKIVVCDVVRQGGKPSAKSRLVTFALQEFKTVIADFEKHLWSGLTTIDMS